MGRPLTVALAQYAPLSGMDPAAQLHEQASELVSATEHLDLVVFPEIPLLGGGDIADAPDGWQRAAAEPLDGPRMRALSRVAADVGAWLIPGSVAELGEDGRLYNTEVVFNPAGEL